MIESDPFLEAMLRTARVRVPGEQLDARLETWFATAESRRRNRMRLVPWAIAAGVAIVTAPVVWLLRTPSVPPVVARMTGHIAAGKVGELRIERDVSRLIDDGIVAVSDNVPYQQIRRQTVRDMWLIDPRTQSRLRVSVPSEQVLVRKVEAF